MLSRRFFLSALAGAASQGALAWKTAKPIAGVFVIAQTPFTTDAKLDSKTLEKEILFLDRTGTHGVVWPQLASEYVDLSRDERLTGMEVVAQTSKSLRLACVLGVQANDTAEALAFTKRAESLGPDALIALPPRDWTGNAKILDYYKAIGANCSRPLIAQTIGNMSVPFVSKMLDEVPNLQFIKDEAGETLPRLSEFRAKGNAKLRGVFTGAHGKTMIDELMRGSAGTMPAAPFADLYVRVWNHWKAGETERALDAFSRISVLVAELGAYGMPGIKYLLELRGVFSNHITRRQGVPLDTNAKAALKMALDFAKPLLTGY